MFKIQILSLFLFSSIIAIGQKKDFEKAIKENRKVGDMYLAKISKALTKEKFAQWSSRNNDYILLGSKSTLTYVFGVPEDCVYEVSFVPKNRDAVVLLPSGKLLRTRKDGTDITYDYFEKSNRGLYIVKKSGSMGCLNEDGEEIIPVKFKNVIIQNNGLVKVVLFNEVGFYNKNGQMVTPFYEKMSDFNYGLALVKLKGKVGYINDSGQEVVSLKYDDAREFNEKLAAVKLNGKWGFINTSGKEVIPLQYVQVENFKQGNALVSDGTYKGCLNSSGNETLPVRYPNLRGCSTNEIAVVLIDEGSFTGYATYRYSDGTYTGGFVNGLRDGKGRLDYGEGEWYDGYFKNGKKHGYGEERFKSKGSLLGYRMTGNYINGNRDGIFRAKYGTLLTGYNEWQAEFDNGTYISLDRTSSNMDNFLESMASVSSSSGNDKKESIPKKEEKSELKSSKESCEQNALLAYSKLDKSKIKYRKWSPGNGDFDEQLITFPDGVYGTIFLGRSSKKYFLLESTILVNEMYYKDNESVINALYIYKKCKQFTKIGKK